MLTTVYILNMNRALMVVFAKVAAVGTVRVAAPSIHTAINIMKGRATNLVILAGCQYTKLRMAVPRFL